MGADEEGLEKCGYKDIYINIYIYICLYVPQLYNLYLYIYIYFV